jgi:hypothetical protein
MKAKTCHSVAYTINIWRAVLFGINNSIFPSQSMSFSHLDLDDALIEFAIQEEHTMVQVSKSVNEGKSDNGFLRLKCETL